MLCQTKSYNAALVFSPAPWFIKHKVIIQPWHFSLSNALSNTKSLFNLGIFPRPMVYQIQSHYSTLAFFSTRPIEINIISN
jgi:hypothetical protein